MKNTSLDNEFVKLIQNNEKIIYKVCSCYVSEENPLPDLYQEAIYNLWKAFPAFRHDSAVSTWIYRIALNSCITGLRKEMRKPLHVPLTQFSSQLFSVDGLDDNIREMYRLIRKLSAMEKAIVMLYLDEQPYQEIAKITGLSPSNVGTRLARIREKLKRMSEN